MASSNRHWPSLFKSKPCTNHHQWQHDINHSPLLPSAASCHKPAALTSGLGGPEERSPEPKPRWNPKPEQIRILESIFNSGMVNPPREEIRKIRAQLQEYGQVGDANVFYWFQNRKSRSKHKQRHLHSARNQQQQQQSRASHLPAAPSPPPVTMAALQHLTATSSSSSSSERSTGSDKVLPLVSVGFNSLIEAPPAASAAAASPTASVNQIQTSYFQNPVEFLVEPAAYLHGSTSQSQGFFLSSAVAGELPGVVTLQDHGIGLVPGWWTELMMGQHDDFKSYQGVKIDAKIQNPNPNCSSVNTVAATSNCITSEIQAAGIGGEGVGGGGGGAARATVFINGVAFDVVAGPFNVREVFGQGAVLIHASGHPVLTDEWGLTLHPLQHGASYFLI